MDTGVFDYAPTYAKCGMCKRIVKGKAVFVMHNPGDGSEVRDYYHPSCAIRLGNRLAQLGEANVSTK